MTAHPRAAGLLVGGVLLAMPAVATPLGRLGSPFALLIVLPVLALALDAAGWSRAAATTLRRVPGPATRLIAAYGIWLGTSALLTLDVAATAGATVGVEVAGGDEDAQRWHLGAAILGANVGSLLLPFSNLTNLVVVGATGIGFVAYVATAWVPQAGAALACGTLLAWQAWRFGSPPLGDALRGRGETRGEVEPATLGPAPGRPSAWAGVVALAGGIGAIAAGVTGADMAIPFAAAAALLAASAVAGGHLAPAAVVRSVPVGALALVTAAAVLSGPVSSAASALPRPPHDVVGLVFAVAVGGLLAASLNNLPAAAVGAVWLTGAPVTVVVAYLVGTNIAALATPHGSAATMLVRSIAARSEISLPALGHVRLAWRYALAGSVAAGGLLAAGLR